MHGVLIPPASHAVSVGFTLLTIEHAYRGIGLESH